MNEKQAEALLEEAEEVVPYARTSINYAQQLVDKLWAADIPALIARTEDVYRMDVLVRAEDVQQVADILGAEWRQMAEREGTFDPADSKPLEADEEGEMPCPACGTAAPLVDGACSDCGLQLE